MLNRMPWRGLGFLSLLVGALGMSFYGTHVYFYNADLIAQESNSDGPECTSDIDCSQNKPTCINNTCVSAIDFSQFEELCRSFGFDFFVFEGCSDGDPNSGSVSEAKGFRNTAKIQAFCQPILCRERADNVWKDANKCTDPQYYSNTPIFRTLREGYPKDGTEGENVIEAFCNAHSTYENGSGGSGKPGYVCSDQQVQNCDYWGNYCGPICGVATCQKDFCDYDGGREKASRGEVVKVRAPYGGGCGLMAEYDLSGKFSPSGPNCESGASDTCGNTTLDEGEECDSGEGCSGNCRCSTGYKSVEGSVSCVACVAGEVCNNSCDDFKTTEEAKKYIKTLQGYIDTLVTDICSACEWEGCQEGASLTEVSAPVCPGNQSFADPRYSDALNFLSAEQAYTFIKDNSQIASELFPCTCNASQEYCGPSAGNQPVCCEPNYCAYEYSQPCLNSCYDDFVAALGECNKKEEKSEFEACVQVAQENRDACHEQCKQELTASCARDRTSGGVSPDICSQKQGCAREICLGDIDVCNDGNICTQDYCSVSDGVCVNTAWIVPVQGCTEGDSGGAAENGGTDSGETSGTNPNPSSRSSQSNSNISTETSSVSFGLSLSSLSVSLSSSSAISANVERNQSAASNNSAFAFSVDNQSSKNSVSVDDDEGTGDDDDDDDEGRSSTSSVSSDDDDEGAVDDDEGTVEDDEGDDDDEGAVDDDEGTVEDDEGDDDDDDDEGRSSTSSVSSDDDDEGTVEDDEGDDSSSVSSVNEGSSTSSVTSAETSSSSFSAFESFGFSISSIGNTSSASEIRSSLVAAAFCGDGILQRYLGEECDLGALNDIPGTGAACSCDLRLPSCVPPVEGLVWQECRWARCGDGIVNNDITFNGFSVNYDFIPEQCDDGNTQSGDGCSAQCTTEIDSKSSSSSSASVDTDDEGALQDDDAIADNDDEQRRDRDDGLYLSVASERLVASAKICGNGVLEPGEECDDSNRRDSDGCNAECLLEFGICGDGIVQRLLGEQCEQATHDTSLGYSCVQCEFSSETCGDNVVDPGEECDDGEANSTSPDARCRPGCRFSSCGDGILDSLEECEDGNRLNGDGCDRYCTFETPSEQSAVVASDVSTPRVDPSNSQLNPQFPRQPTNQILPFQLPLAQLQPLIQTQAPVGDTGPAAVAVIGAGAAAGWSFMRRKKK